MVLMLVLGVLVILVALPVAFAIVDPVVNVVDDLTTTTPLAEVDAELARLLGNTRGHQLQLTAPGTYTLSSRRAPAWAWALGLITFPLGILIVLLCRETLTLTFAATATGSGTRLQVVGHVHRRLAEEVGTAVQLRLEQLRAERAQPARQLRG